MRQRIFLRFAFAQLTNSCRSCFVRDIRLHIDTAVVLVLDIHPRTAGTADKLPCSDRLDRRCQLVAVPAERSKIYYD